MSCPKRFRKLVNRPTFKHSTEYNENMSAVSIDNTIIEFLKPNVGFAVLDVSKTMMYDYHYNLMKKHYCDTITLMYTDTGKYTICIQLNNIMFIFLLFFPDSLMYYIKTKDFYMDLKENRQRL